MSHVKNKKKKTVRQKGNVYERFPCAHTFVKYSFLSLHKLK